MHEFHLPHQVECQMMINHNPPDQVECQMETSKQKTVTFEFHTTDINPDEMANTFISEELLAEQHRRILVEQLIDIVNQLAEDPATVPQVISS